MLTNRRIDDGITLVLGSDGKTGWRVAERLLAMGREVRPISCSPQSGFDWEDRSTWSRALRGVRAAYVSHHPDLLVAGALDTVRQFFATAVDSGVRKLVLLSARGESEPRGAEDTLRALDVDWTILRASWSCQSFSEGFFLDPLLAGLLVLPVGSIAETFIDADDIADVAVAALSKRQHQHQLYELSGPRALTFVDAVGEIARATGREPHQLSVLQDAYRTALRSARASEELIGPALDLLSMFDGRNTAVTDGVQRALGRAPRDFADYAKRAAATGAWGLRGL